MESLYYNAVGENKSFYSICGMWMGKRFSGIRFTQQNT